MKKIRKSGVYLTLKLPNSSCEPIKYVGYFFLKSDVNVIVTTLTSESICQSSNYAYQIDGLILYFIIKSVNKLDSIKESLSEDICCYRI